MPQRKSLVYIVCNEKVISSTLALILNRSGIEVFAFTNPLHVLSAAESRCPDFVVAEVAMFEMGGIELGIQFNAIYPQCKVILFSGSSAVGPLLARAKAEGHDFMCLAMPVHPRDLLRTLKQMGATAQSI